MSIECPHGHNLYDCMDCSDFVFLYEENGRLRKTVEQYEADARLGRAVREMFDRAKPERCTRCGGCGEEPSILPDDRSDCGTCCGTGQRITVRISQQWFESFTGEALRKERA